MPTIVNTYRYAPPDIGAAFSKLGSSLFGPGRLQAEFLRQKAQELGMDNEARAGIAGLARKGAIDLNDPVARGYYFESKNPQTYNEALRGQNANMYGADDPRTTNAFVGAGGAYGSTAAGFNTSEQNKKDIATMNANKVITSQETIANNTPTLVLDPTAPTGFRTVSRAEAIRSGLPMAPQASQVEAVGKMDVLKNGGKNMTQPQLKAAGAQPNNLTPHNYITSDGQILQTYDGTTDSRNGQPLPPGMIASAVGTPQQLGLNPTVASGMQTQDIALQKLKSVGDYTRSLIAPGNVGIPGYAKSIAQDATQIAGAVAQNFGFTGLQDAIENAKSRAAAGGVSKDMLDSLFSYDPKLPQLQTAYYGLVMTAADALAGGTSKASDKDIKLMKNMLGNPNELFANPEYLNSKLDAVNEIITRLQAVNAPAMHHAFGGSPAAAPAAPAAPAPAPAADPLGIR